MRCSQSGISSSILDLASRPRSARVQVGPRYSTILRDTEFDAGVPGLLSMLVPPRRWCRHDVGTPFRLRVGGFAWRLCSSRRMRCSDARQCRSVVFLSREAGAAQFCTSSEITLLPLIPTWLKLHDGSLICFIAGETCLISSGAFGRAPFFS